MPILQLQLRSSFCWHKALPTYIEVDVVYIEFKTGHPNMVGKRKFGAIVLQGGVTNGVDNVK